MSDETKDVTLKPGWFREDVHLANARIKELESLPMTTHTETQRVVEELTEREKFFRECNANIWADSCKNALGLITRQQEEIERLTGALKCMVYETTSLSPLEDDGSHKCRITKACLAQARAALQAKP